MKINESFLTYCTNIHPGNNWSSHFEELRKHLPGIKAQVSPDQKMGIGLRVSHQMAEELTNATVRTAFKNWLDTHHMFVFLINGFPYGQFHQAVIKDKVHQPDWTTSDRLNYTLSLAHLLADLLPEDTIEGGISTSPLSYRHWYKNQEEKQTAIHEATQNIIRVAEHLHNLHLKTGKIIHLDVEPEPDGLIENGAEFIQWYEEILLPEARISLSDNHISPNEVEGIIRRHIQLCYDVCHMAVEFEDQMKLTRKLRELNIPIGRLQLSSALRLPSTVPPQLLEPFDESQYLHQVVIQNKDGTLIKHPDLPNALKSNMDTDGEWRIHFHVPLFTEHYGQLQSTRDYVEEIIKIQKDSQLTNFLEIETYTWEVLPPDLQCPIGESISREIEYIAGILNKENDTNEQDGSD